MKQLKLVQLAMFLMVMATALGGCSVIGDIFKAGVWVGILVVVGIIVLILFLVGKSRK